MYWLCRVVCRKSDFIWFCLPCVSVTLSPSEIPWVCVPQLHLHVALIVLRSFMGYLCNSRYARTDVLGQTKACPNSPYQDAQGEAWHQDKLPQKALPWLTITHCFPPWWSPPVPSRSLWELHRRILFLPTLPLPLAGFVNWFGWRNSSARSQPCACGGRRGLLRWHGSRPYCAHLSRWNGIFPQ